MEPDRSADTFILRVRREHGSPPTERWQVEHVQTGINVYVHSLEEAVSIVRSALAHGLRKVQR